MTAPPKPELSKIDVLRAYKATYDAGGGGLDAWHVLCASYPYKRVMFLLEKLNNLRLMECGVSTRTSWITHEGEKYLKENS